MIQNYSDLFNGLFEGFAGMFILLNIIQLNKDKQLKGVSAISIVFFTIWGLWNTIFYPMNGLFYSFIGGLFVAALNLIWIIQILYYKRKLKK